MMLGRNAFQTRKESRSEGKMSPASADVSAVGAVSSWHYPESILIALLNACCLEFASAGTTANGSAEMSNERVKAASADVSCLPPSFCEHEALLLQTSKA